MNTSYEKNIICPYCDHEFSDSWEYNGDSDSEIECVECEKSFVLEVDFDVSYSSSKIHCDEDQHDWKISGRTDYDQKWCDDHKNDPCIYLRKKEPDSIWIRKCQKCEKEEHIKVAFETPLPKEWKESA